MSVSFRLHDQRLSIVIPNARSFPHALIKQLSEQVAEGDEILVIRNRPKNVSRDWVGITRGAEARSQPAWTAKSNVTIAATSVIAPSFAREITPLVFQSDDGAAAARNKGWRTARNDSILFLDDDVIVGESFLTDVRGYLSRQPIAGLVMFRVCNMPSDSWSSLVNATISLDRGADIRCSSKALLRIQDVWKFGAGAALLADRSLLEHTGGFKDQLGSGIRNGGAEDTEFIWHTSRHAVVEYYGHISVLHGVAYTFQDITRKLREYGRAIGHLAGLTKSMDGYRYMHGYCSHLQAATQVREIRDLPMREFLKLRFAVAFAIMESFRVFTLSLINPRPLVVLCHQCREVSF